MNLELYETTYYNRQGEPISLDEWFDLSISSYKNVKKTDLDNYTVSTVWLGSDPDRYLERKSHPNIFETMVFKKGTFYEVDTERYPSEDEAIKGHDKMVLEWMDKNGN